MNSCSDWLYPAARKDNHTSDQFDPSAIAELPQVFITLMNA